MREKIGKFLKVEEMPPWPGDKGRYWDVLNNANEPLGHVHWYSRWRQYVFAPGGMTEFNSDCLADIKAFLDRVNKEAKP